MLVMASSSRQMESAFVALDPVATLKVAASADLGLKISTVASKNRAKPSSLARGIMLALLFVLPKF